MQLYYFRIGGGKRPYMCVRWCGEDNTNPYYTCTRCRKCGQCAVLCNHTHEMNPTNTTTHIVKRHWNGVCSEGDVGRSGTGP